MAVFHSDTFNQASGNVLIQNRTPVVGGSWVFFQNGDLYACSSAHPETDARLRVISVATLNAMGVSSVNDPNVDFRVQCDIGTRSLTGNRVGVVFRVNTATNSFYRATVSNNTLTLSKFTNNVEAVLATAAWTWGGTSVMKELKVEFTKLTGNIKVFGGGTQLISYTDASPLAAGRVGITGLGSGTTAVLIDNFLAESIESPTGALTSNTNVGTAAFVGVRVTHPVTTLTSAGAGSAGFGTFWFQTGYLNYGGTATLAATSVPFVTRSATFSAGGVTTVLPKGSGRILATMAAAGASVFSSVSNSLREGEAILTAADSTSTASFASEVVNGSSITAPGKGTAAFVGQRLGNTFVMGGSSSATFIPFDRKVVGTLSTGGTSSVTFWPFGRVNAGTFTSAGLGVASFGDIKSRTITLGGTGVATFKGGRIAASALASTNTVTPPEFILVGLQRTGFDMVAYSTTLFRPASSIRFHAYIIG